MMPLLPRERELLLQEEGSSLLPRAVQVRGCVYSLPTYVGPSRPESSLSIPAPDVFGLLQHA